eukprot:5412427-Alexandrium_andersonii.AAC.1
MMVSCTACGGPGSPVCNAALRIAHAARTHSVTCTHTHTRKLASGVQSLSCAGKWRPKLPRGALC